MRPPGLRALLVVATLALVGTAMAALFAIALRETARLAGEEGLARAERGAARAVEALERSLDAAAFERGTEIEIVVRSRAEVEAAFGDLRIELWRRALDGAVASRRFPGELGAVAVQPVGAPPVARIAEARIPGAALAAPVRRFAWRAAAAAATLLALALASALLIARRLAAPVVELSRAAAVLAGGDLGAPVPVHAHGEVGTLAGTLERMRLRLREANEELARRSAELEAVLASVSEGVFAVDRERRIRYLSPRAAALLGVSPETAVGRFCGDVLAPAPVAGDLPCEASCPILQARFRGPVRALERLRMAAGERLALISSSPPSGGLQVQIVREETVDEAARRARDAIVADLAHELKTPLAAQRASLELLDERLVESDPDGHSLALAVEAGALRLQRLIENLLESVRIESGELGIRRLPVEIDALVEEVVGTLAPVLAKREQRAEIRLPHPLPRLVGDPQRLEQALVNLLANASKFAPEGSVIEVGAEVVYGILHLWVEDPGPGFDPAELSRLTSRFRREPAGRPEPRQEGSGLGLWIARSIAERHGGGLEVERVAGRTRVGLRLPASEAPA